MRKPHDPRLIGTSVEHIENKRRQIPFTDDGIVEKRKQQEVQEPVAHFSIFYQSTSEAEDYKLSPREIPLPVCLALLIASTSTISRVIYPAMANVEMKLLFSCPSSHEMEAGKKEEFVNSVIPCHTTELCCIANKKEYFLDLCGIPTLGPHLMRSNLWEMIPPAHGSPCHSELRLPTAPSQMEFDGKESSVSAGAREELRRKGRKYCLRGA
ncbi:hypothetical protein llap_5933 [Limosa lapponica baueri]|uniref:Uncharacterized protein n=1 Tax=Limosa lapponica baueri TaxID=1758121 RepID=A0A2I0UCQ8_LIMLA|nr:hypothetical protein llap_5933 [Limosa lapponica baueri]